MLNLVVHYTLKVQVAIKILRKTTSPFRVWTIALYDAESLTLRKVDKISPGSSEMWSWRRTGKISWTDRVRNE